MARLLLLCLMIAAGIVSVMSGWALFLTQDLDNPTGHRQLWWIFGGTTTFFFLGFVFFPLVRRLPDRHLSAICLDLAGISFAGCLITCIFALSFLRSGQSDPAVLRGTLGWFSGTFLTFLAFIGLHLLAKPLDDEDDDDGDENGGGDEDDYLLHQEVAQMNNLSGQ